MSLRPEEVERKVARVGIGLTVLLAAVVGMAVVSNSHHPEANSDDSVIAAAIPGSVTRMPVGAPVTALPVPVREASGTPILRSGFGHLQMSAPMTYANLTVYPVYSTQKTSATASFVTLGEAMSNGAAKLAEPSGSPDNVPDEITIPAPSVTNAGEGSEHRDANLLIVTNTGPAPTYVPDGTVTPGGDQDRGVAADTIVPGRSANVSVAAFCVEHGRSQGPTPTFTTAPAIAAPSVRYAMQVVGEQQPVWDSVAVATSHFGAATESGTYSGLLRSNDAQVALTHYTDALVLPMGTAAHGQAQGVVVAINGKIVCADLYRSPALFAQLWPSLLRSYAMQAAMVSQPGASDSPTSSAALHWLSGLDSAPGQQSRHADLTQVARVSTWNGAGIRTAATADGTSRKMALLHEAFFTPDAVLRG